MKVYQRTCRKQGDKNSFNTLFVDASHSSDKVNRQSQTGVLIFVNRAPVIFHSKRQNVL